MNEKAAFYFDESDFPRIEKHILVDKACFRLYEWILNRSNGKNKKNAYCMAQNALLVALRAGRLIAQVSRWGVSQEFPIEKWRDGFRANPYPWNGDVQVSPVCDAFDENKLIMAERAFTEWFNDYRAGQVRKQWSSTRGYDWPAFFDEVRRQSEGKPIKPKAKLVRLMTSWCSQMWGAEPAHSTIKKRVDDALHEWENRKKAG